MDLQICRLWPVIGTCNARSSLKYRPICHSDPAGQPTTKRAGMLLLPVSTHIPAWGAPFVAEKIRLFQRPLIRGAKLLALDHRK